MNELINKLEQIGKSGSLKQSHLKQLIEKNDFSNDELCTALSKSQEYTCMLLPDDDEE